MTPCDVAWPHRHAIAVKTLLMRAIHGHPSFNRHFMPVVRRFRHIADFD